MKKLSKINENIFDGIGRRSKGGVKRKEDEVEQVDLGLPSGTIWAACNLGASSPEEYGNYYAWGETEPKDHYSWKTYKFGVQDKLTKYNKEDGKIILDPEDDVAHVVLGGKWHIPTNDQLQELLDNTFSQEFELNGVDGTLFTSKTNNNSLFFPYSGYKNGYSDVNKVDWSECWSSSLNSLPYDATVIYSDAYDYMLSNTYRCYGLCVRGVLDKK